METGITLFSEMNRCDATPVRSSIPVSTTSLSDAICGSSFLTLAPDLPESQIVAPRSSWGVHCLRISAGRAGKRADEYGRTKCVEARCPIERQVEIIR